MSTLVYYKSQTLSRKKIDPNYSSFMRTEFKLSYKNNLTPQLYPSPQNTKPILEFGDDHKITLLKPFKTFLRFSSASSNTISIPHFSFKYFYLGYRRGGLAVLNINKLFTRWKEAYYLMFNLFYYEIEMLTFATSFFKSEVLSLNWQVMSRFKFMWRYTKPFLSLKPNKITTYGDFIFYRLNLLGLRTALVIDVLYHNKTIYYLHRASFYSLGLVPVNYNISTLNFAIPLASDSLLAQIFFIRFTTQIQQSSKSLRYQSFRSMWFRSK